MAIWNSMAHLTTKFWSMFDRTPPTISLLSPEEFKRAIYRYRSRSELSGCPFSLLSLSLTESDPNGERLRLLRVVLSQRLRLTDETGYFGPGRIGVILVDTPRMGAAKLVSDLRETLSSENLAIDYTVDMYSPSSVVSQPSQRDDVRHDAPSPPTAAPLLPATFIGAGRQVTS